MNKREFMIRLQYELRPLPEKERVEILEEYDAHFEFGKQLGRTEEEIAKELGVPEELAEELLGDGARYEQPSYGGYAQSQGMQGPPPQYPPPHDPYAYRGDRHQAPPYQGQGPYQGQQAYPGQPPYPPYEPYPQKSSWSARIFGLIGIGFASLILVPLLIAFWGVVVSLVAVAGILLLMPVIYAVKLLLGGPFFGGELSVVLIVFGLGIFFSQFMVWFVKVYGKLNLGYAKWIVNTAKGGI
ncbi:DUF1700 domain-containing protein [Paenibacillus marinisediminis]